MFKQLFKSFNSTTNTVADAETVRQQLQSMFFKIKTYQKYMFKDKKLNFKVFDNTINDADLNVSGQISFFLGEYIIRYDFDNVKSIQLFRRGQFDNIKFAELLAISLYSEVEYISDQQFVQADIYQLEILINRTIKNRHL